MTMERMQHEEGNRHGLDRGLGRSRVDHLGPFQGDHYDDVALDAMLAFAIPHSDLETARSLYSSKWWDYRYAHPGHCFFYFASLYGEAVESWRSKFGIHPYARMSIQKGVLFRYEPPARKKLARTSAKREEGEDAGHLTLAPPAFRTGLWRAMCSADAHGIPYDRFISLAMQIAFDWQFSRLPLPTAFYTTKMITEIVARWQREEVQMMHLPKDPRFFAASYEGHEWQKDQQEWLMSRIAATANPVTGIAQYLARERRLVPALAVQRFGAPLVRDAIERARRY